MNKLRLKVNGQNGYVFEGVAEGSVAFVPAECVMVRRGRDILVDEASYLVSGWADKNMRFSSISGDGHRLWPRPNSMLQQANDYRVEALLRRLRHAYDVEVLTADS